MKKIVSTIVLVSSLLSTVASADFTRVEMGIGAWDVKPSGTVSYNDGIGGTGEYQSSQNKNTTTYAWLLVKHPIPMVPNLRLEYAKIEDTGSANGTFDNFVTVGATQAKLTMHQYDVIPYYNILDNTFWTTVDLGVDIKVIDASYEAKNVNINGVGLGDYTDSKTIAVPMAYGRLRVEIPATHVGLEADVKYVTYSGSTVYDTRAKIDYTFDISPVVQPAFELGYRVQKFDLSSGDDKTKVNMDFKGFYAGLMLRF